MKKILIRENEEVAIGYIQNVENIYISSLNTLSHSIAHLGMGVTKKDWMIDAIKNNGESLEHIFNEFLNERAAIPSEMKPIASMLENLVENTKATEYNKMAAVRNAVCQFKQSSNTIYNGMRIDNPTLFDWFEVNESGIPYLVDSIKETIRESVKEYTSTNAGAEMLKMQQSLAKDIQRMYDLMVAVDNGETTNLQFDAHRILHYQFPMGLFNVTEDRKTGNKVINPININFDPEQVEQDVPFLDEN